MEYLIPSLVIIVLIGVNGVFVAAEFAIAAASRPRVAQMAEQGSAMAQRTLLILNDSDLMNRYISTAQVGITLASLGLGMYGEHSVAEWLLGPLEHSGRVGVAAAHSIATILSVAFLTYLHVVLGEMIPKSFALQGAARAAILLGPLMAVAERIFRPLTLLLNAIGSAILRTSGLPPADEDARLISTSELAYIVEESSESGYLDAAEQFYLENVIDFHERTVSQVMTPRTRMIAIPEDADLATVLTIVEEERHSRFPVFREDRDHVVGVLHVKELSRKLVADGLSIGLSDLIRSVLFVPESLPLDDMLDQFRSSHNQIAIVLDEFGGTAGLITMEDLAEEIIGEIQDEFDEELPPFEELEDGRLLVRGDLLLDELTQHFDLTFDSDGIETIGGLIMSMLGQVPKSGDKVHYGSLDIEVDSVEGLAVRTVLLTLPDPSPSDEGLESGDEDLSLLDSG